MSRRPQDLSYKTLFTLLFFLFAGIVGLLRLRQSPFPASAGWFDDTWGYRKAISIPSHTTAENNVYVTVPTFDATDTTKLQADCGDLRFTKTNGELLPYYVIDCDATATVHVQFDTLPAGASVYYMYYGNPSALNGFESADFASAASNLGPQALASEEKSPGPVAYWKFDEGYGNTTSNSTSIPALNATLGTNASWKTEDQCVSGKCIYIDDSGSSTWETVYTNDHSSLGSMSALTIGIWIKTVSSKTTQQVVYKRNSGASPAWYSYMMQLNSLKPTFYVTNASGTSVSSQADSAIELNKWYYLTGVYDGSQVQIYVNSVAADSTPASLTGAVLDSDYRLQIGGLDTASSYYVKGYLDEPKIYNYARTAAQIKQDYNAKSSATSKGSSANLGSSIKNQGSFSDGLVGYWKMDEASGNAVDSSGNGNTGTANGTTVTSGKFGNSRQFNGTSDYISIGYTNPITATSVVGWFKKTGTPNGDYHIITGGPNVEISINQSGGGYIRTGVTTDTMGRQVFNSGTGLVDGNWHQVAMTYDGSSLKSFIDGTQTASNPVSGNLSGTAGEIGRYLSNSYVANGIIDEVRVYNRALSPKEVRDLYNWAPGPVGYYDFEESSGTILNDKSGNNNNGTMNSGLTTANKIPGKYGSALLFDGVDDNVEIPHQTNIDNIFVNRVGTACAWVKPSTGSGYKTIFAKGGFSGWHFRIDANNTYYEYGYTSVIKQYIIFTPTSFQSDVWQHVCVIYNDDDSSNQLMYLNGTVIYPVPTGGNSQTDDSGYNLIIGAATNTGGRPFVGGIDEVKIYNYARTSKQIIEDMNGGHPAGGSPVGSQVGYWKFDEGYGTNANDSSSQNNILSITNATWQNTGKFGKALNFDGTGDFATKTDTNNIHDLTTGTITFWAKLNDNYRSIAVTKGDTESNPVTNYYVGTGSVSKWLCGIGNGTTQQDLIDTNTAATNVWTYVACTFDGNRFRLYINGVIVDDDAQTITPQTNNGGLQIGRWGTGATYEFNGLLDEVKIYNSALTEDEIKLDYNQGQAMVLGSMGSNASYEKQAANQEYCVPGDATACAAPVGEWKFEEKNGGYAYDTSGNGNTGTITNATWTSGKIGSALNFGSQNDNYYVTVNDTDLLDIGTNDLTITAWIKHGVILGSSWDAGIVYKNTKPGYYFSVRTNSDPTNAGKLSFGLSDNASTWTEVKSNNTVNDDAWHFVAVVADRDANATFYIDGKANGGGSITGQPGSLVNATSLKIGVLNSYFNGLIDQVRVYNYARTPAQIAYDYNRGAPVGHWKMDECQGVVAHDSADLAEGGTRSDGTISIGTSGTQTTIGTCTTASTAWGNGATGKLNSSLNFDGLDDYIKITSASGGALNPQNYLTLSAWVYWKGNGTGKSYIISKGWEDVYDLTIETTGKPRFRVVNAYPDSQYVDALTAINQSQWYLITGTYDQQTLRLYINGTQVNTSSYAKTIKQNSSPFKIGANQQGGEDFPNYPSYWQMFNGQIDDVKIFNYALSAEQIKTLYANGAVSF